MATLKDRTLHSTARSRHVPSSIEPGPDCGGRPRGGSRAARRRAHRRPLPFPAADRSAARAGPGRHDLGRLPADSRHELGRSGRARRRARCRVALVAIDFEDQPFVITQPKHSDPFGNPQIDPVPRADVAKFYADFWGMPGPLNHGHTIHEYWMEQSRGQDRHPEDRRLRAVPHAAQALRVRAERIQPGERLPDRLHLRRPHGARRRRALARRRRRRRRRAAIDDQAAHLRRLRRDDGVAGIRRDEVREPRRHPRARGAIRTRRSRAG